MTRDRSPAPIVRLARRLFALALPWLALAAAPVSAACSVASPVAADLGTFSPAALKAGAPPPVRTAGGFGCTSGNIVTLLGTNYLKATVVAGTVFRLTSATTGDVAGYTLSAAADGTSPLLPGVETYYVNGTLLNLLGLLGPGTMNVPVYARPQSANRIAPGTYTGAYVVQWDWYFCSAIGLGGLCVGDIDSGSRRATVNLTLIAAASGFTMTLSPPTITWDPVDITTNPKAIPGGRLRVGVTVTNPDIVPADLNTIILALPTPAGLAIALDGDGASARPAIQLTEGPTPSTLTLDYASPASLTDDVDFSANGGTTWTYGPVAGDPPTQSLVTSTRLRPKGMMAARSSFQISVSYSVR